MEKFEKIIAHIHFDSYNPVCVPCSEYPQEWWGHRNAFGLVILDTRTWVQPGMKSCPLTFKADSWGDPQQIWKLKRLRHAATLTQGVYIPTRDLSVEQCLKLAQTNKGVQVLCGRVLDYFGV